MKAVIDSFEGDYAVVLVGDEEIIQPHSFESVILIEFGGQL